MTTSIPLLLAPLFIFFEATQLVIAERFLGVKQIEAGVDPRELGPGESIAFAWSAGILVYWFWMVAALIYIDGRTQAICMLVVSIIGYAIRRSCGLKWVLVVLTLEGAIRIGMLVSLIGMAWRSL